MLGRVLRNLAGFLHMNLSSAYTVFSLLSKVFLNISADV